jgi:solute carrier family 12 sodium/potassium/chloride transporter 2
MTQDPAKAIPKGTLLALLISMASYVIFVVFAGMTAVRDASGVVDEVANGTAFYCYPNRSCDWGLINSYSVRKTQQTE